MHGSIIVATEATCIYLRRQFNNIYYLQSDRFFCLCCLLAKCNRLSRFASPNGHQSSIRCANWDLMVASFHRRTNRTLHSVRRCRGQPTLQEIIVVVIILPLFYFYAEVKTYFFPRRVHFISHEMGRLQQERLPNQVKWNASNHNAYMYMLSTQRATEQILVNSNRTISIEFSVEFA